MGTPHIAGRLSAISINRISEPGLHADGRGLYLQVNQTGARSWLFRFMIQGHVRDMGLGSARDISLADARRRAEECRLLRSRGIDPIEARKAEKQREQLEAQRALTFLDCAEAYIAAHSPSWRNAKHIAQWSSTLAKYAYPVFGNLPVQDVDTALVMKVLEPIWTAKPTTAGRLRGRIECILDWATAKGSRTGENPARWRGHIQNLLPNVSKVRKVKHHSALPYTEIAAFMAKLRQQECTAARALELLILSACRTSEVLQAQWTEFDLDGRIWTIPAERMKAHRAHRVPLSDAAVALLRGLPRKSGAPYLFEGHRLGQPLSNMAMLSLLHRMGRFDITTHGFRSTFRDWSAEKTHHPNEVSEMALAHTVSNKVEASYRRGDLFEKRTALMTMWAQYCLAINPSAGE